MTKRLVDELNETLNNLNETELNGTAVTKEFLAELETLFKKYSNYSLDIKQRNASAEILVLSMPSGCHNIKFKLQLDTYSK